MANQVNSVLTEDFLLDLYGSCFHNDYILAMVMQYVKKDYLPDKSFVKLHNNLRSYYKEYRKAPSNSIIGQMLSSDKAASRLLEEILSIEEKDNTEQMLGQLEEYIKQVKFQKAYKESGEHYNKGEFEMASRVMGEYTEWEQTFSLRSSDFVDVISTFNTRFLENRQKHNSTDKKKPITRFYIDQLDEMNGGKDLRTQLTCIMAATGVGKSHAARWIGKNACQIDGLNVLHFQLEGSKAEALNAYSAALVSCDSFRYETGTIRDRDVEQYLTLIDSIAGKLFVKSYPKFNCNVSTVDIMNGIAEFKKRYKIEPDVVVIDSIDLLTDSSGRKWGENGERHKRIAVANDLKDLAADENVWIVATYQSTIEDRAWINDEKNVLTEFNSSEAKGIARPLTHLITLNQSDREMREHTMRLYVAKSRFFERGEPFKIATDYHHECFYDRQRTMNINKLQ